MQKLKQEVFLSALNEMHLSHLAIKLIMPERKEACVIQALKNFSMKKKIIHTINRRCEATLLLHRFSLQNSDKCKFEFHTQDNAECPKYKLWLGRFEIEALMPSFYRTRLYKQCYILRIQP